MLSKTKTSLALAAAAVAAGLPAAAALAAGSPTTPATPAALHLDGAYAFQSSYAPTNRPQVFIVFKTHGQLPRRFDGLVRAAARYGSAGGGSIGAVHGKASHCYLTTVPLRDGRFYERDGSIGAKASLGTRRTLTVRADDAAGEEISAGRQVTIRAKRVGDLVGKPLGC